MQFIKHIITMIIHDPFYSLTYALIILTTVAFVKWLTLINISVKSAQPRLPPGPLGYPILGCLPQMLKNRPPFRWIHRIMEEMDTEIACIRLGNAHIITVTSPELAREFLISHDQVFCSRPVCMSNRLTCHYLTAIFSPVGEQWKKMRRILASHVLSPAKHRWLYEKRREEADNLVRLVYTQCTSPLTDGIVDVRVASRQYAGNVIRKLIFGKRFFGKGMKNGGPGPEEEEHVCSLFTILHYLFGFGVADFAPWLEIFDVDGCMKNLKNAVKSVSRFHDPEIDERIQMWMNGFRVEEEDILDILINLKDEEGNAMLNVEEIKAQITEMMLATVDNPSNAVEWVLAEMINQPDMLIKAQRELDHVVGKSRLVEESDIPNLNYIKACAKEAFRLHPIAPFNMPHVSTKDTIVSGYFIPKGSWVMLSRPGLGRNPRVWKDPLRYYPDRHIDDGKDNSNITLSSSELNLLSFSTGRRGCIGVALGSTMTIMLLARLIHSFDWTVPNEEGLNKIDLTENEGDLFLAQSLKARAVPRLEDHVYAKLVEK